MKFLRQGSYVLFGIMLLVCFVKLRAYQAGPKEAPQEAAESAWPDDIVDENMDTASSGSEGFVLFLLFMATAVLGGILCVPKILSMFGDAVGEAVLASGEEAEEDPYAEARSLVANGAYADAVSAFRDLAKDNPEDRLPVLEMVKLFQDKLDQPRNAILTLEAALRQDHWDDEDKAVYMFRTADIYQDELKDEANAVAMLKQIVETFPKTRHAANATHKLREIDPSQIPSSKSVAPEIPGGNEPPKPKA